MEWQNLKNENRPVWIFPDTDVKYPLIGLFQGIEKEISKSGANEFFVLNLDVAGRIYKLNVGFSTSQIPKKINLDKLIEKYPSMDAAKGKHVSLNFTDNKFSIVPIEENIR